MSIKCTNSEIGANEYELVLSPPASPWSKQKSSVRSVKKSLQPSSSPADSIEWRLLAIPTKQLCVRRDSQPLSPCATEKQLIIIPLELQPGSERSPSLEIMETDDRAAIGGRRAATEGQSTAAPRNATLQGNGHEEKEEEEEEEEAFGNAGFLLDFEGPRASSPKQRATAQEPDWRRGGERASAYNHEPPNQREITGFGRGLFGRNGGWDAGVGASNSRRGRDFRAVDTQQRVGFPVENGFGDRRRSSRNEDPPENGGRTAENRKRSSNEFLPPATSSKKLNVVNQLDFHAVNASQSFTPGPQFHQHAARTVQQGSGNSLIVSHVQHTTQQVDNDLNEKLIARVLEPLTKLQAQMLEVLKPLAKLPAQMLEMQAKQHTEAMEVLRPLAKLLELMRETSAKHNRDSLEVLKAQYSHYIKLGHDQHMQQMKIVKKFHEYQGVLLNKLMLHATPGDTAAKSQDPTLIKILEKRSDAPAALISQTAELLKAERGQLGEIPANALPTVEEDSRKKLDELLPQATHATELLNQQLAAPPNTAHEQVEEVPSETGAFSQDNSS